MNEYGISDGITGVHGLAAAIVDTLREPLLVLGKDMRVIAASRAFYRVFDVVPQTVLNRPLYELGNGEWNIPELRRLLESVLPQHITMENYEVVREFSGIGLRTMLLNARQVHQEKNAETLILLAIEDVTERRAAERETAFLLQEKEVLLQEMQHRVANSLQIIASILLLKARTVQSEEIRGHLQDAHQRILSVAAVQRQLQASRSGELIELSPYLTHLCDALQNSMIGGSRPISITVRVPNGRAHSTTAVNIGLIVTELVINALKHAFTSQIPTDGGRIVVAYDVAGTSWRLTVSDNGIGSSDPSLEPGAPGLGTSIIEAIARQLEGQVDVAKTTHGTTVSISHGSLLPLLPTAA